MLERGVSYEFVKNIVLHEKIPAMYFPSKQDAQISIGVGKDGKHCAVIFLEEQRVVITVRHANKHEVKKYESKYHRQ
jgi:uncharacterized DUF497 family protein